ncbi:MAG TPA: hypothetical protein QGF58_10030 [Myxococcota bacterium]|nr:hypothetical protein [Myxococcota bacterium]
MSHRGGRARRTNDELARVATGRHMRRIINETTDNTLVCCAAGGYIDVMTC